MIAFAQKIFDLSFLELLNDKKFVVQVIELYLLDSQKDMWELKHAAEEPDFDTVYKITHKLKSSTGMLQANALYELFEQIEKAGKQGDEKELIPQLVETTSLEYDRLRYELKLFLNKN